MEEKDIEEIVNGICPSCDADTAFKYIGTQEGIAEYKDVQLYNCLDCGTTISLKKIYRAESKVIKNGREEYR